MDSENYSEKEESAATVVRGDDGKLYLLRKEILDACEVTEPDAIELCNKLLDSNPGPGGDDDAAAAAAQPFDVVGGVAAKSKQFLGPFDRFNPDLVAKSTVMCAGNMRWFDFKVGPEIDNI